MKSLDLHIIDIVHNSIRAKATEIVIEMVDSAKRDLLSLKIIDNGCGMPKEMMDAINETFYSSRPERKIGMGIALLKFHSELCNGKFYSPAQIAIACDTNSDFAHLNQSFHLFCVAYALSDFLNGLSKNRNTSRIP